MIRTILADLVQAYVVIIIVQVVLSYFPTSPGSPVGKLAHLLGRVTEPVYAPLRRVLPPIGVGGMGLDLSPVIVLLVLELVVRPIILRA
ncbi:MAG: YggT family protein [Acidimicrobiales bacterium]